MGGVTTVERFVETEVPEPPWSLAACRNMGVELFFSHNNAYRRAAKLVCARCPIQPDCLDWATETKQIGVWGGQWFGDSTCRPDKQRMRERTLASTLAQYNEKVMATPCPACKATTGQRCKPINGNALGFRPIAPHKKRILAMDPSAA